MADDDIERLVECCRSRRALPTPAMARSIREQAGVSQAELGAAIGVTRPTVSRWESGRRSPRRSHVKAYVDVLSVLVREVLK